MPKKIIIFDLDGTLALIEHRRHLVSDGNNKWDEFYRECINDEMNYPVCVIFASLARAGYDVQIWSGRSDAVREQTESWLMDVLGFNREITLRMRPRGDCTPDDALKGRWLLEVGAKNILMVFDDRQKVVDMWRRYGVTCLQVAEGNF